MNDSRRRDFLKVAGGVAVVGSLAGCAGEAQEDGNGGDGQGGGGQTDGQQQDQPEEEQPEEEQPEEEQPEEEQTQEGTGEDLIRVAHMVPDFPAVDVYVDGSEEPVISGIEYTDVTGYIELAAGDHQIRVTTAGSQGLVIFDQQVTVPGGNTTAVALPTPDEGMSGEQGGGGQQGAGMDLGFQLQLFGDQNSPPAETISNSRIRLIHAAPDAPAVSVLVGQTTVFDNVGFGEAAYFDLPAGDYEFNVVPADSAAGGNGGGGNGGGGNESNGGGLFSQLAGTGGGGGVSLLQDDGNETEEGQPPEEGEEEGEPAAEPVLTFDASTAANSVYTVFVTGYVNPEGANSEAELTAEIVQDVTDGEPVEAEDE